MSYNILVTGATGLIGKELCFKLKERGHKVSILTHNLRAAEIIFGNHLSIVEWSDYSEDKWEQQLKNKDAIIHLAGANLNRKRWTAGYKKMIIDSRVKETNKLIDAIKTYGSDIKVLISASAVGYYGSRGEDTLTEDSSAGSDFLANVCTCWENAALAAKNLGIRTVLFRQGVVLSDDGGALKKILLPYKFFIGGSLGKGNQWFPWIHVDDLISTYLFVLDNHKISGAINAVSPASIRMKEFAKTLGKVLNRPSIFTVPEFALRVIIGEAADAILSSQKVIPKKLMDYGYKFKFENLEDALRELLKTKRT